MTTALLYTTAAIAHLHALWLHTSIAVRKWSMKTGHPYLITLHGMLEPWAVRNSRWKKRLAFAMFEGANLRRAKCIHATSEGEWESARAFGLTNAICIIPNGIDIPTVTAPEQLALEPQSPLVELKRRGNKILLFLGRIHRKKGLVNLLRAWRMFEGKTAYNGKRTGFLSLQGGTKASTR